MKKIIIAAVAIGLATLSASSPAWALGKIANPQLNLDVLNGSSKGQSTDSTSPGDAFSPDTAAVGDPKAACIDQGGRPVRIAAEYDFVWSCKL